MKDQTASPEEYLIGNTSALALCLFLLKREKVDLSEIESSYNNSIVVRRELNHLCQLNLTSLTMTGKNRAPRYFLTDTGRDIVQSIIEAAAESRAEAFENEPKSIGTADAVITISHISGEAEVIHSVGSFSNESSVVSVGAETLKSDRAVVDVGVPATEIVLQKDNYVGEPKSLSSEAKFLSGNAEGTTKDSRKAGMPWRP